MMLPILISLSLAPGSYFFWAGAGPASATSPAAIDAISARFALRMASSIAKQSAFLPCQPCGDPSSETGRAGRHQVDKQQQNDPVDRAGQALGEGLGDIRHEQHEETTDDRSRD